MKKVKLSFEYGNTETVFNILYDPYYFIKVYTLCAKLQKNGRLT